MGTHRGGQLTFLQDMVEIVLSAGHGNFLLQAFQATGPIPQEQTVPFADLLLAFGREETP